MAHVFCVCKRKKNGASIKEKECIFFASVKEKKNGASIKEKGRIFFFCV